MACPIKNLKNTKNQTNLKHGPFMIRKLLVFSTRIKKNFENSSSSRYRKIKRGDNERAQAHPVVDYKLIIWRDLIGIN
jgi:hypothetical protein